MNEGALLPTHSQLSCGSQRSLLGKKRPDKPHLFWLHCKFQIRALGIKNQFEYHLEEQLTKNIATLAFEILVLNKLAINKQILVPERLSGDGFLHAVIRCNDRCCVFITKRILGKGTYKSVYEGIQIELDAHKTVTSVKVSSVALWIICQKENVLFSHIIDEDERANLFESGHIIKKSTYSILEGTTMLLVLSKFLFDFDSAINLKKLPSLEITLQAVCDNVHGLAMMHKIDFIHRDVKTANMGIKTNWRGILIDLGFAVPVQKFALPKTTPQYIAPELIQKDCSSRTKVTYCLRGTQNKATDLWALGISLYEIFSPKHESPFFIKKVKIFRELYSNLWNLTQKDLKRSLFSKWKAKNFVTLKIQSIIEQLLSIDPNFRGNALAVSIRLRHLIKKISPLTLRKYDYISNEYTSVKSLLASQERSLEHVSLRTESEFSRLKVRSL